MQYRAMLLAPMLALGMVVSPGHASPGDARAACQSGCFAVCMKSVPQVLKAKGGWYQACPKSANPDATTAAICKAHEKSCSKRCRKRCNF